MLYDNYDYENYEEVCYKQPKAIQDLLYDVINPHPKMDILSIGCGNGYLEEKLVEQGHNVFGFELTDNACQICRKKGINCARVNILDVDPEQYKKRFDWIIAIDLWEHIMESELFLKKMGELLKPKGRIFLKSPNYGHLKFRWIYFKNGSLNTDYQRKFGHVSHYTYKETLKKIDESDLDIAAKYCFSFKPWPMVFDYHRWLFPNLSSISIILILENSIA